MHPDALLPGSYSARLRSLGLTCALAASLGLPGCAAPAPAPVPAPPIVIAPGAAKPGPAEDPPAAAPVPAQPTAAASTLLLAAGSGGTSGAVAVAEPVQTVLAYIDRIRPLTPADLAQEINRLGEAGDSPVRALQLAAALALTRLPANSARAQALLQRVLAQTEPDSRALHPLARLVATQFADARRLEEQIEKQNQQIRDNQRRIEQLNDRLEAVRAIERSVPSRPGASAPAPANGQRP